MYFAPTFACLNPLENCLKGNKTQRGLLHLLNRWLSETNLICQNGIGVIFFRLSCLNCFNNSVRYMLLLMSSSDLYVRVLAIAVMHPSNVRNIDKCPFTYWLNGR